MSVKYFEKITSDGKKIKVYDDLFSPSLRIQHNLRAQERKYTLHNSRSTDIFWQQNHKFFISIFSQEDFSEFRFENEIISEELKEYEITNSWMSVTSPLSYQYSHCDSGFEDRISLLYHVNTRWDKNWGGETLFGNASNSDDFEYAIQYKPGRVVIFDSRIEHRPAAISSQADEFRFAFVLLLRKKL